MPSTLIDARQITRCHAARTVLDAVDVRVDTGSRVALVEVLEAALDGWPGALVVATHDRRLRDALRLDRGVKL